MSLLATSSVSIINVDDGQAYALQPSNSVIIMEEDGDYKPSQLSFQSVKLNGTDNPSSYSGRFKIEKTSDETNWTTEYTSSSDESSTTYNMPSKIEDQTPYMFRPTCNGDNVGSKAFDTIVGGTVAWNQQIYNSNFASDTGWANLPGSTRNIANNECVLTITANWGGLQTNGSLDSNNKPTDIAGHKYFISADLKSSENTGNTVGFGVSHYGSGKPVRKTFSVTTSYATYSFIGTQTTETVPQKDVRFMVYDTAGGAGRTLYVKNVMSIDLTQLFGSTIADYIYSLEQSTAGAGVAWFRKLFPNDYYPYDAGTLKSVEGLSAHETVGFNQCSSFTNDTGGTQYTNALWVEGQLLPNTTYCLSFIAAVGHKFYGNEYLFVGNQFLITGDGTRQYVVLTTVPDLDKSKSTQYTAGSGWRIFKNGVGNTVNPDFSDVCINLSLNGDRNGEYEPYVKHTYPLDSDLVLRGIPKLDASNNLYFDGDTYEADGTVTRRYGVVDLGTISYTYDATNGQFQTGVFSDPLMPADVGTAPKYVCAIYTSLPYGYNAAYNSYDKVIFAHPSRSLRIRDSAFTDATAFKTAMSGVYLVYELATPTTEEAEPYVSPQIVDRYGTEEYITDSIVPVGHETKYTSNISSIRCSLYASGGTTTLLDQQIIPVINDAESAVYMTKQIEEYRLSDSSTSITGSGDGYEWADTVPSVPSGKYLWKRLKSYFSNGSIAYSDAVCDVVMSGLVFDVDRNTNAITSKVWESDITTKINEYDGSTGKSIRDRVTKTETDISGINTTISDIQTDVAGKADGSTVTTLTTKVNTISDTVDGHTQTIQSNTSRIDDAEDEIESTKTVANQTADKFTWLVKSGTSASNFTLTSRVAELISPQVVIKDPAGSATIITGGKIQANAITANMLAANAIKSTNYNSGVSGSDIPTDNYSLSGTFLDLSTGNIYTPNFAVDSVSGEAYLNGTIYASAGQIGNPGDAYWSIGTVYDSTWGDYAGLIANGNALIQSGKLTLSSDRLNSQNAGNYIQSGGYWYDFGLQVPDFTAGTDSHDQNFLYVRRIGHQPTDGTLDTDWSYLFRVDKSGNIYWKGHDISDGTFLPLGGGEVTGATTFDSTLTVKGKLTASSNVETNLMLQTNLGSTSSAQLTGAANAVVKPGVTGTLGVGNGGTGKSSWTANRLIYSSASNTLSELGTGTSGQILKSNGSSAPSWVNQSALSVGTATKATQDGDGNVITDTYRALDDDQFDTIDITDAQIGNLMVTGAGRFTNGLYGDLIGNADTATTADKVGNNLVILLNGGTTEGTNKFTYNGSAAKNINITRSSIGLGDAADKAVDTSISASSTSANLPTSAAVATFVEGKGYVTSSGVTSVRVQATSPVVSSVNTAQSSTLNTTISLADGYGDTKNPYGTKTKNYVLAGPTTGSAAAPTFRALVADDIPTLTPAKVSLGNVTNDKQVKGLSSGTTSGNLVSWGANGYTVADSGIAVSSVNKTVKSLASNNDGKIVLTYLDGTTSDPIEVKIIGSSGSSVSYADALNVNGKAVGGAEQPVFINNQGKPQTANKIPKLNNGTTGGTFYAPTGVGTSGQVLKSSGSGAPTWVNQNTLQVDRATKDGDGNTISSTYLKLSGGTLTNPNNIFYNVSQGSVVTANVASVLQSPIPKYLWHDIWAFCKATTPKYYTTTNGTTWVEEVLEKRLFAHLESWGQIEVITNNIIGSRWEWDNGGLAWCGGAWLVIGVACASSNAKNAKFDVLLEESADTGESGTWTTLCSSTGVYSNAAPVWIKTNTPSKKNIRLTIIKNSKSSADATLPIISIRWLSLRWGNQGKGQEYEYPYTWDGEGNITAKGTFTGTFSGNATSATSATKATQDSDGNTITSTYVKKAGDKMTGLLILEPANGEGGELRLNASTANTSQASIALDQYNSTFRIFGIASSDGTTKTGMGSPLVIDPYAKTITGGYTLTGSLSGNATSATKATQDGNGAVISSTYAKLSGATFTGAVSGTSFAASSYMTVNSGNSGTIGGLALYGTDPTVYGIAMRQTVNGGKHGYVQGDWGIYSYMTANTDDIISKRGWVLRDSLNSVNIASVSAKGHAVFNGSITVGGNAANTSGMRMEFDATLQCTNFVFN